MQDADWQKVKDFMAKTDREKKEFFENPTNAEYLMIVFEIMKQCLGEIYGRLDRAEKTKPDWWEGTILD